MTGQVSYTSILTELKHHKSSVLQIQISKCCPPINVLSSSDIYDWRVELVA